MPVLLLLLSCDVVNVHFLDHSQRPQSVAFIYVLGQVSMP